MGTAKIPSVGNVPGLPVAVTVLTIKLGEKVCQKPVSQGFPDGAVVKNPPANAGDTGSIPGPGRYRMPQSN